ncbi:MAG: FAD-binding protein [Planctomycetes bacterium]|nr:FAD-binding protein [Planctomycetota bacterium]
MTAIRADVLVIGSGFGGSLAALMAHQRGRRVILMDRARHPRFAIGESSTPIANLLLERIAVEYDLPWLRPFARYGEWKRVCPNIPCGPKRGLHMCTMRQVSLLFRGATMRMSCSLGRIRMRRGRIASGFVRILMHLCSGRHVRLVSFVSKRRRSSRCSGQIRMGAGALRRHGGLLAMVIISGSSSMRISWSTPPARAF